MNVPKDILDQIKSIPGCEAIIFTGSRQQGGFTDSSDWDFYVLLSDEFKSFRKTWIFNGQFIETFCNTLESIDENELINSKISNAAINILATGIIVHDTDNRMLEVQRRAIELSEKGPPGPSEEQKLVMGYTLKNHIDDLEALNELNISGYYLKQIALQFAVESYYKLGKRWMPRPRSIESDIQIHNPAIGELYVRSSETMKAVDIVDLLKSIADIYNIPMNGEVFQYRS